MRYAHVAWLVGFADARDGLFSRGCALRGFAGTPRELRSREPDTGMTPNRHQVGLSTPLWARRSYVAK
jgi:hypothetical protein